MTRQKRAANAPPLAVQVRREVPERLRRIAEPVQQEDAMPSIRGKINRLSADDYSVCASR